MYVKIIFATYLYSCGPYERMKHKGIESHTFSSGIHPDCHLWDVSTEIQLSQSQDTFEFLPNICHLLVYPLLFQLTDPCASDVRNELPPSWILDGWSSIITYLSQSTHVGRHLCKSMMRGPATFIVLKVSESNYGVMHTGRKYGEVIS